MNPVINILWVWVGVPVGVVLVGAGWPEMQVNWALEKLHTQWNAFINTYKKSRMAVDDGETKKVVELVETISRDLESGCKWRMATMNISVP